ncbi:hypothetical protein BRC65_06530 [Halobacteriales archaeon QH_2_65_14]|nr:MAG: hypothetical protein BRC65_06530 [Halobacteriales archaeon QH_2_65_14]
MIVELIDESGGTIGKFQSAGAPRVDETISYDSRQYVVRDVHWVVETNNNQNIERIELVVSEVDEPR